MKKFLQNSLTVAMMAVSAMCAVSCDDDDDNNSSSIDEGQQAVLSNYVNEVIIPTYKSLADAAIKLAEDCEDLSTQDKVNQACEDWKAARQYWELSEAFLFGAAGDYNIDPHIDSWPLDLSQLAEVLKNGNIEEMIEAGTAGYGLLGFHAVEYVIFKDGGTGDYSNRYRDVTTITDAEKTFAKAVAEDMRDQCVRLEAAWAGLENVTDEKQEILADAELEPSLNYGEMMINAGLEGNSKYKTQAAAFEEILVGASDIANEVGNTKISDPMNSGNWADVESPHSWNSVTDFVDNMKSVRNAYYGSLDGSESKVSVASVIAGLNADKDAAIKEAIANAISALEAMPTPFRNYIDKHDADATAKIEAAVAACNVVVEALDAAQSELN